ncbi:hypothetical protein BHM03_00010332 [Ensete ventricosum]|nr:hypothetical protein BHM03_00010332 [Ensete ventricosum]
MTSKSRRAFMSIEDGAPEDVPEELALGFSGLFPVDLAEGMDLTLEQEFEEVIPTYLQRGPIEGARQSEDRSGIFSRLEVNLEANITDPSETRSAQPHTFSKFRSFFSFEN